MLNEEFDSLPDDDFLSAVYKKHKDYCIKFMQKMCNGKDHYDLKDIYQDAIIVVYEKRKADTLNLSCSYQTYLNSVCRNQLLNKFKNVGKIIPFPDITNYDNDEEQYEFRPEINDWLPNDEFSINGENDSENGRRIKAIAESLEIMNSKGNCYEILKMFFYHKNTMEEIANKLKIPNSDAAKAQKYKCQEKLKKLSLEKLKK